MPDIVALEAEKQVKKGKFNKIFLGLGGIVGIALVGAGIYFAMGMLPKKTPVEETKKEEKTQVNIVSPKSTVSYKIKTPQVDTTNSFIYSGDPAFGIFSPLTAYFLTKDNQMLPASFFVSAANSGGKAWCFGEGKDLFVVSQSQNAYFCLENTDGKIIAIKRLSLIGQEFKEYTFASNFDLFSDSRFSKVISSRDGDSALIYSPSGAFVFESASGNLFKMDLPLNLEITKVLHLSNTESAFITGANSIYRVNFSNHRGGLFGVNFTGFGFTQDQLKTGLMTARLSKDSRRIVFTISDLIETLPADKSLNFQPIKAYNIDLSTAKVSDELNYEERFLVSCKFPLGNRFCLYKYKEEIPGQPTYDVLYLKEFDKDLVSAAKTPRTEDKFMSILPMSIDSNSNYFFVRMKTFPDPKKLDQSFWINYIYDTSSNKLSQLN